MGVPRPALLCGAAVAALWLIFTPACGQEILDWDGGSNPEEDGGKDGGFDAGFDAGLDAGFDAGFDAGTDAGPALVISELAGAGSGTLEDEFVELYNRTESAVSLAGWSLEYASAPSGTPSAYHDFDSADSVAPHGFYLVGHPGFSGDPDDTRSGGIQMSAGAGTMYLRDPAGLTLDQVGWGSGAAEGASTVGTNGAESVERKAMASSTAESMTTGADVSAGNGHDTNNNQQDFVLRATRDPQNRSAPAEP